MLTQGRFRLLPPAPHSCLNCRALHYNPIIHASLIKAVNQPHCKAGKCTAPALWEPWPGVCGGLTKGYIDWLLSRSVWPLSLIMRAGIMAKGSLVPDTQA